MSYVSHCPVCGRVGNYYIFQDLNVDECDVNFAHRDNSTCLVVSAKKVGEIIDELFRLGLLTYA